MPSWNRGFVSTPDNPGNSPLMIWIRDVALPYQGDDCLTWPFTRIRTGYGRIGRVINGKMKHTYVHRYICEWAHGAPPAPEYQAAHSCGNGHLACANPKHLSWKTATDNQLESRWHPRRKVTVAQVIEIRAARSTERTDITAARFGISEGNVRKIQMGQTWGWVKPTTAHIADEREKP